MTVKELLLGVAASALFAGAALAGQPMPLSEAQMDRVTAGQSLTLNFPNIYAANLGATTTPDTVTVGTLSISFPSGVSGLASLGVTITFPGLPSDLTSTF
jgi:hypothetical protein